MPRRSALLAAAGAVTFLTRVPLGRWVPVDARAVAAGAPLYPLVGACVGALGGVAADAGARSLPVAVAAVLAVALVILLTGGMHVDAFADTADSLGGTTVERRLAIMRDHAVGAFGATAIALSVVLQVALVAELARRGETASAWTAAAAASRWAPVAAAWALPYARGEGEGLAPARSGRATAVGLLLTTAVCLTVAGSGGVLIVGAAVLVAAVSVVCSRRLIGGVTGDTLGATAQVAELAALTVAVAAL